MPASTTAGQAAAHRLTVADRRAMVAILLAALIASLDTAIANTALPAIAADLDAAPAASVWIVNAYQLTIVATLLPFAALGDRYGPRRVYLFGMAFFTAASLACALAGTLTGLAVARAVQGIGAGALMSVNIALVRLVYPPARLGRGVGLNALVVGVGFAVGPTVASLVLAVAPWPWLFAINVPIGFVALACALPNLPRTPPHGHRFDTTTALFAAATFAALFFALGNAAQQAPWPRVVPPLALALVLGALLLRRQRGHAAPMLPVDLLRRPMFALSALTAVAAFMTQGLAFVGLPFWFETVLHRDPVQTGFLLAPWPIVTALAAPVAGRLSDRHPVGVLGGIGLALLAAGMLSLLLMPRDAGVVGICARMALCGAGFGMFQSPNLRALMSSAPPERSGGASGMIAIVRLTGQTSGAALVALCFGVAGAAGPSWALGLGAASASIAALASFARIWAR